ncbi:chemotaxis protein [Dechloromonas agitata]|uniref:chemotaxis protein n=1 Tax=Dechloromonas agitata TaxID=73030 RepID=UPI00048985D5|nr:chemotaxis protein [Dechloromonas agitata]
MSDFLSHIDARTRLAGANKLEMLLFGLGFDQARQRRETYGINVFKVREVMLTPEITVAPDMPSTVAGMVSLRGALLPVVDLAKYAGVQSDARREILIVTEYNGQMQGFLVESVDHILRLDWGQMRIPPQMLLNNTGGLVTAVTELEDGRLVMMLDVEKVLSDTAKPADDRQYLDIQPVGHQGMAVFFCDDSLVARAQIRRTLDALQVSYVETHNGYQAWEALDLAARQAEARGIAPHDAISLVLTDIEMPEMDGYLLTRKIKSDPRFERVPVIMHSSLCGNQNQKLGLSVGADEYISKFDPQRLAVVLRRWLTVDGEAKTDLSPDR